MDDAANEPHQPCGVDGEEEDEDLHQRNLLVAQLMKRAKQSATKSDTPIGPQINRIR